MKPEKLTVRLPEGWKEELTRIGKPNDLDASYLTRQALKRCYPTLEKVKK